MSGDSRDLAPLIERLDPKEAKCSERNHVTLDVVEIVTTGMCQGSYLAYPVDAHTH